MTLARAPKRGRLQVQWRSGQGGEIVRKRSRAGGRRKRGGRGWGQPAGARAPAAARCGFSGLAAGEGVAGAGRGNGALLRACYCAGAGRRGAAGVRAASGRLAAAAAWAGALRLVLVALALLLSGGVLVLLVLADQVCAGMEGRWGRWAGRHPWWKEGLEGRRRPWARQGMHARFIIPTPCRPLAVHIRLRLRELHLVHALACRGSRRRVRGWGESPSGRWWSRGGGGGGAQCALKLVLWSCWSRGGGAAGARTLTSTPTNQPPITHTTQTSAAPQRTRVPVQEGLAAEHSSELLAHALEHLLRKRCRRVAEAGRSERGCAIRAVRHVAVRACRAACLSKTPARHPAASKAARTCTAVVLPTKVADILRPRGGMSQMEDLTCRGAGRGSRQVEVRPCSGEGSRARAAELEALRSAEPSTTSPQPPPRPPATQAQASRASARCWGSTPRSSCCSCSARSASARPPPARGRSGKGERGEAGRGGLVVRSRQLR